MRQDAANPGWPVVVALAGWLVPGAGYWLIGQRGRSLSVGLTIICLFVMGLWIGAITVVAPPISAAPSDILDRPWFIGQVLAGPMALAPVLLAGPLEAAQSHGRPNELGVLFTAIAGMLNLLAIMDSGYRARRGAAAQPRPASPTGGAEASA